MEKHARLLVLSKPSKVKDFAMCLCDCGTRKAIRYYCVRDGITKSCGCFRREVTTANNITHGMAGTRIYTIWQDMIKRTTNPKRDSYKNYGGRGITVCERWHDFSGFYADMKDGYADNLTIERKDYNKGYSPKNCCWATQKQQARNTSRTVRVEYEGKVVPLIELSERFNKDHIKVRRRLTHQGWSLDRALTTPT